jgi:quercetin 2,3-dioxygenase
MNTKHKKHLIHDRNARGKTQIDWLDSRHTFSFGGFYDPNRLGFRTLRVINDDRVIPGAGFGTHSHQDMEIITYVLKGELEHKDSLGNGEVIKPGEAQIMSAGTGITHSEFNPSNADPVHFLQIWILPNQQGIAPRYEQRSFPTEEKQGKLRLIVAPDGGQGAVTINQDVELYVAQLEPGQTIHYQVKPERYAWVQLAQGNLTLNDESLQAGDGIQISGAEELTLLADTEAEVLIFDLA